MIKSGLVQTISQQNMHLYHRDVERIINTILDEITEALAKGDRVELPNAANNCTKSSIT